MQGLTGAIAQCLDALWTGQEHARSLRGVGHSDLERGLGPAPALWSPGSLAGLSVGQMTMATLCCIFVCVTTCRIPCAVALPAERRATGCSAKVGFASCCCDMGHIPSTGGLPTDPCLTAPRWVLSAVAAAAWVTSQDGSSACGAWIHRLQHQGGLFLLLVVHGPWPLQGSAACTVQDHELPPQAPWWALCLTAVVPRSCRG